MIIRNRDLKEILILNSIVFISTAVTVYLTNPNNKFNALVTIHILNFTLFYVIQTYKYIKINGDLKIIYLFKPNRFNQKINNSKIRLIFIKVDNLMTLNPPWILIFTKQFPFIFSLFINSFSDAIAIINFIKKENPNVRIKASKYRLNELEKAIKNKSQQVLH